MDYNSLKDYCQARDVQLVAVSKTRSVNEIMELYNQGQRHFGENRVQEWLEKKEELPSDIHWHLIGHLQTNKVKFLIPHIHLIHSIDSLKLLNKVNQLSEEHGVVTQILLQYKVAREESKFGLNPNDDDEILMAAKNLKNIEVKGLMAMGTFTNDDDINRQEFKNLISIFERLKKDHFPEDGFNIKSMGMSGDYQLAIENGSNMVRVGSLLFG